MSGLVKAKKYDWKDSNLALFGSDTEKQVKKESAESEPAWQGCGQETGLKIWRIVDFEVVEWDKDDYGEFFNGDSYIVLNTYKEDDSEELKFDVHFWIGKNSTQDEYGTVAYKTVELDTFLDDRAVQHRECQGHESDLFKSYFPNGIRTMEGGAASGFKHVEPEAYIPRLMHFNAKGRRVTIRQVPLCKSCIKAGDVYILDKGKKIIQYNSSGCSVMEKTKAREFIGNLTGVRGDAETEVVDEDEGGNDTEFMETLTEEESELDSDDEDEEGENSLLKLNVDENKFEMVKTGDISSADFAPDDVFLLDTPNEIFVWVGGNASVAEKRNGLPRAHEYMKQRETPSCKCSTPLTVLREGNKSTYFEVAISA